MRTLYHFPLSPFSQRARLALAHKKLEVELLDARADAAVLEKAKKMWPLRTIPVLVDTPGDLPLVIGDSTAIVHYLEEAYPGAPHLWPKGAAERAQALGIAHLVDGALNAIVDVGARYYGLHGEAAWKKIEGEMLGRAQGALDHVALLAEKRQGGASEARPLIASHGWSAADIYLFSAVAWLESLPARASTSPNIAQIMTLPWSLPGALSRWAAPFRGRDDVKALQA